ncbi:hypothetical protein B0H11DRAFT_2309540 [Mycena galericulata]|nr:hypothetical protein B0H11DRAFT_2309540 [Mycena galericulata]
MQQSSDISQTDIPRTYPCSVSLSSSDPGIAASLSDWQPHIDEKDPDASVIHISSEEDDTFTITRTGGTMFGIPVTPFSVSTSSVRETRWFLEHIRAFHELLERAKHQDDGSAVLKIFERTGNAIGADLVMREAAAGIPLVIHERDPNSPLHRFFFSLRNEDYADGFQPKLLYLNPENYEISMAVQVHF